MNTPQDTLQAVSDAAFTAQNIAYFAGTSTHDDWEDDSTHRRAVIQHALDNPALAPFLAGGPVHPASAQLASALESLLARDECNTCQHEETHRGGAIWTICDHCGMKWADDSGGFKPFEEPKEWLAARAALKAFSAAPLAAGGIGEYTDSEIIAAWDKSNYGQPRLAELKCFLAALPRREIPAPVPTDALPAAVDVLNAAGWSGLHDSQWAKLKDALPRLAGILAADAAARAEKAEKLEEELSNCKDHACSLQNQLNASLNEELRLRTELAALKCAKLGILRLPAAEAMPPAEPEPEPASQVPLGPEDVPPGSVFRSNDQPDTSFWTVSQVWERGFYLRGECVDWHLAMERMEINTSIPDTGRWDKDAWRPCSKLAGKETSN